MKVQSKMVGNMMMNKLIEALRSYIIHEDKRDTAYMAEPQWIADSLESIRFAESRPQNIPRISSSITLRRL